MATFTPQFKPARLEGRDPIAEAKSLIEQYMGQWALDILIQFRQEAISVAGLDSRSNIVKSFDYKVTPEEIKIFANDYIDQIERGRLPGELPKVPFDALLFWARRYRVRPRPGQTEQGMIYAIQAAIYRRGIAGRPFVDSAIDRIERTGNPYLQPWIDDVLQAIIEPLRRVSGRK